MNSTTILFKSALSLAMLSSFSLCVFARGGGGGGGGGGGHASGGGGAAHSSGGGAHPSSAGGGGYHPSGGAGAGASRLQGLRGSVPRRESLCA